MSANNSSDHANTWIGFYLLVFFENGFKDDSSLISLGMYSRDMGLCE